MSKTILYTAVSLDGYIADEHGKIDFLDHPRFALPDEDYGYASFLDSVDTIIMGYNTYAQIISFEGGFPYKGKECIVLSRSRDIELADPSITVSTDASVDVLRAQKASNKIIWLVGGGATNAQLHGLDLIDEMILTYIPTTLGKGIPLFRENEQVLEWSNVQTKTYPNGLVQIHLVRS